MDTVKLLQMFLDSYKGRSKKFLQGEIKTSEDNIKETLLRLQNEEIRLLALQLRLKKVNEDEQL